MNFINTLKTYQSIYLGKKELIQDIAEFHQNALL